ncbi:hypothetical protein CHUAL_007519 [Chamberlinius hualienensis]
MYRSGGPYLRSSLARAMYDRMQTDAAMIKFDKSAWYQCTNAELLSPILLNTFVQCHLDVSSQAFVDNCQQKSDWLFTQLFHSLAATMLGLFMTKTSINGLLNRGSMFVFSDKQFESLLGIGESWKGKYMLDIGAGDGKVTEVMAKYFEQTFVTEASPVMRRILSKKDYKVLGIDTWPDDQRKYDLISCLNVLDRCNTPITLLKLMMAKVNPDGGLILLAFVTPFQPYVEFGHNGTNLPIERMNVTGVKFEEQVNTFYENVLKPLNLEIVRWTKLPYLCEGNLHQSFYWLTDAVFIIRQIKMDFLEVEETPFFSLLALSSAFPTLFCI